MHDGKELIREGATYHTDDGAHDAPPQAQQLLTVLTNCVRHAETTGEEDLSVVETFYANMICSLETAFNQELLTDSIERMTKIVALLRANGPLTGEGKTITVPFARFAAVPSTPRAEHDE